MFKETNRTMRNNLAIAMMALLALSACGKAPQDHGQGKSQIREQGDQVVISMNSGLTVVDTDGKPVKNARVMIGMRPGVPFPDNILTTDEKGMINLPAQWTDAQPVTIASNSHIKTTYFEQMPGTLRFVVKRSVENKRIQLGGQTSGYGELKSDGFVDAGMIFPAVPRSQASLLAITDLMSAEMDIMTVMGQKVEIPTNVAIPSQRETYVLPLTLAKPQYRYFFRDQGSYDVASVHVRFPLKALADGGRAGKSIFEMINHFSFMQATVTNIPLSGASKSLDLTVNTIPFSAKIDIAAPNFNPKLTMVAIALANHGGNYYATDTKKIEPKQTMTLAAPQKGLSRGLVVSILTAADLSYKSTTGAASDKFSTVTTPANQSSTIDFLPLVQEPSLRSGTLVVYPPQRPKRIQKTMTFGVLSKVEVIENEQMKLEKKIPQWELYANDWATNLELPEMPATKKASGALRWEVTFVGAPADDGTETLGPDMLEKVSHVTRSAIDL